MRVLVRRGYSLVNDLRFSEGPIYIGRLPRSQVFLPDKAVSRRHAVILTEPGGNWIVQDLESANRTSVNGKPVTKMPLHEGDVIGIADFSLEIHFETDTTVQVSQDTPVDLEDTIVGSHTALPSIYQTTKQVGHILSIPSGRIRDLYDFTVALCRRADQDELVNHLAMLLLDQFEAYHAWVGLREDTTGPITTHAGIKRGPERVGLESLLGKSIIKQAMKDEAYILAPDLTDLTNPGDTRLAAVERIRSAMSAPITSPAGAYGIIYVDNAADQPTYTPGDLDYLTILASQVAAFLEHIG
jgi:pSer/pThr/pTyr-binding forkhead associated (FHA) protein